MIEMSDIKSLINEVQAKDVIIPKVIIEKEGLHSISPFLISKEFKNIIFVVDENTKEAAGNILEKILVHESFQVTMVELKQNKHEQIVADEQAVMQLFSETSNNTDVLLAVGSGTIHDIVRFVAHKINAPFISVPTAASVDGFASKGAPLIFRGFKQTIQTSAPIAIFVDINIIKSAPQELTAAGFGDIVGKYTSLLDWKVSSLVGGEPYNELAADLTKKSLDTCVLYIQEIADRSDKGLTILMESLIEAGLVMLVLDFSRPASGSEHHLSHYWEMDLLKKDKKQLLHGAQVGVAATIIIDLYKKYAVNFNIKNIPSDSSYARNLTDNWNQIKTMINKLPSSDYVRELLKTVGGITTSVELNIDNELVEKSLNEAFRLRDRCTGLFLINKYKEETIKYPFYKLT